jgi:hypothetical protein
LKNSQQKEDLKMANYNYWLVGAAFGNGTKEEHEEQFQYVIESGTWHGWDPKWDIDGEEVKKDTLDQRALFKQIKKGDRIAIKKQEILAGQPSKAIIRAIGIVKVDADVCEDDTKSAWRVYVEWLPVGENGSKEIIGRKVSLNGCTRTINRFDGIENSQHDAWLREVFCI